MGSPEGAEGLDVSITKLKPLHERKADARGYKKILASVKSIGLIEPLCVCKDQHSSKFVILDGYLRYLACLEMGIEVLPCIVYATQEAYTFNKMVNKLSPLQENRMLRRSLETLDKKLIAMTFGISSIQDRLNEHLLTRLHSNVSKLFDNGKITKACAYTLTLVTPERQLAIVQEMERAKDFSPAFARAMIINTPHSLRAKLPKNRKNPWDIAEDRKKALCVKLSEVETRHTFYTGLYRQYMTDMMKLVVYLRRVVTNDQLSQYLKKTHPDILERVRRVVFEEEKHVIDDAAEVNLPI